MRVPLTMKTDLNLVGANVEGVFAKPSGPASLGLVGINYREVDEEGRAHLVKGGVPTPVLLASVVRLVPRVREIVVLRTCNRVEAYVAGPALALADLHSVAATLGIDVSRYQPQLKILWGGDAIAHLLHVSVGLDSMVLGETEILGQVKESYDQSLRHGFTGRTLNKLFQLSFERAKWLRSTTGISRGATSISSIAVSAAMDDLDRIAERSALVIGAGHVAEKVLRALERHGLGRVYVTNHRPERAELLAIRVPAAVIPFADRYSWIRTVDVLITATSSPEAIVGPESLQTAIAGRDGRPLLVFDLAIPPNVDPSCGRLPGVRLWTLFSLRGLAAQATRDREASAVICRELAQEEASRLVAALGVA
ncbi:MAG: hypothetical protein RL153_1910 [Verrucomicrobiota bacterium]